MTLDGSEFLFRKTLWDIKMARSQIRRWILVNALVWHFLLKMI